ncbi:MAG: hypothetical protein ITG02_12255 [Patulibacter sp.]|nr:hypothetical protein [Patulibacter sp.]
MSVTQRLLAGSILVLMFIGGFFMWLGNPYMWLRLIAANAETSALSMGQAVFLLAAIAVTGFVMIKVLAVLNSAFIRAMGGSDEITIRPSWSRSLRDDANVRTTASALDVVMVTSVSVAILTATIWFFFFASLQ